MSISDPLQGLSPHEVLPFAGGAYVAFKHQAWGMAERIDEGVYRMVVAPEYDTVRYQESLGHIHAFRKKDVDKPYGGSNIWVFGGQGELLHEIKQYDSLQVDAYDHLIVRKGQQYGLLNPAYGPVIDCEYQQLRGLAPQMLYGKQEGLNRHTPFWHGLLGATGQILSTFTANESLLFGAYEDHVLLEDDQRFMGKPLAYSSHQVSTGKRHTLPYDFMERTPHSTETSAQFYTLQSMDLEGYSRVRMTGWENYMPGSWGLARADGAALIPNEFDYLVELRPGLYRVALGTLQWEEQVEDRIILVSGLKWGLMNDRAELLVPIEYTWISIDQATGLIKGHRGKYLLWDQKQWKPDWQVPEGEEEVIELA